MDVNFIEHEILEDLINTLYPNYYQTELGGEYPIYKIKEHEENYNFELEVLKQFKKL